MPRKCGAILMQAELPMKALLRFDGVVLNVQSKKFAVLLGVFLMKTWMLLRNALSDGSLQTTQFPLMMVL